MEIFNQRLKILDAMENIAKWNNNFATKVMSTENVEKKCKRSKKKESNLFVFQVINLATNLKLPSLENY